MGLDDLITNLGFGWYQFKNYILASSFMLLQPWQFMLLTFTAREQPFYCDIPGQNEINLNDNLKNVTLTQCYFYKNNKSITCNYGWIYESKSQSIIAEWDLVCQYKYLAPLASSVFHGGSVVGALLFSMLSDRFGRRRILFITSTLYTFLSVSAGFSTRYWVFITIRFLEGIAHSGNFVIHIVIITELLPKQKRYLIPVMSTINFSLGYTLLALISYYMRDWRMLQITTGALLGSYVIVTYFLDESIYWLVDNDKPEAAKRLVVKAARWNKVKLVPGFESDLILERNLHTSNNNNGNSSPNKNQDAISLNPTKKKEGARFLDLFVHPQLRRRTLLINFGTLFLSQVYMGMTFSTQILPGNLYLNFALIGLTELPGKFLSLFAIRFGRRKPIFLINTVCAILLMTNGFIHLISGEHYRDTLNIALFMIIRSFIGGSMAIAFVIISEIFPTSVRNTGYGLNNSLQRAGFQISPFMAHLYKIHYILWPAVLATCCMFSAIIISFLPATKDIPLPESLEQLDNQPQVPSFCGPMFTKSARNNDLRDNFKHSNEKKEKYDLNANSHRESELLNQSDLNESIDINNNINASSPAKTHVKLIVGHGDDSIDTTSDTKL